MMSPMKWLITSVIVILLLLGIVYAATTQNIATRTTAEIEVLADTLSVGVIRGEIDENGVIEEQHFNKDELVANLTARVVEVQKDNPHDIKLDYLFYDKENEITEEQDDIRSLQIRVQYIAQNGDVQGTAERRIEINQLDN